MSQLIVDATMRAKLLQVTGRVEVRDEAGEVLGCSVAAVFFNRRIYKQGALLVCLASRLLEARVEASPNVSQNPDWAVRSLLRGLNLLTEEGREVLSELIGAPSWRGLGGAQRSAEGVGAA